MITHEWKKMENSAIKIPKNRYQDRNFKIYILDIKN